MSEYSDIEMYSESESDELLEALNTKNYIEWNTTSINHILIILSGHNGNKNKILADKTLLFVKI